MGRMYLLNNFKMKIVYFLLLLIFFASCKQEEELPSKLITSKIDCIVPKVTIAKDSLIPEIEDGVTVVEIKQTR